MHDTKPVIVYKADGTQEIFNPSKLLRSLSRAGANEATALKVVEEIAGQLLGGEKTFDIHDKAFHLLHMLERHAAMKYSLKRALSELGPEGFTFEKYFAEILKTFGYEVVTNQIVKGNCVEHEIDVVAWSDTELIFIEAKFHNEFWLKSDLKTALYVKARYDDIRGNSYEFGGKRREFTDGWLVTNTKFTDKAIAYAECKGMKLVGWSYPQKESIQHMIEESRLHPITVLSTLSRQDKQLLMKEGMVLCRDVKERTEALKNLGHSDDKVGQILDEVGAVCEV